MILSSQEHTHLIWVLNEKKKEKLKATRIQKSFDMALVQIIEA